MTPWGYVSLNQFAGSISSISFVNFFDSHLTCEYDPECEVVGHYVGLVHSETRWLMELPISAGRKNEK